MQTVDDEGIIETTETPDEFDGLFDDPITVLVPSKTDSTKTVEYTVLPSNRNGEPPTTEQLQTALKTLKPTCAGIVSEYSCGNHDTAPAYSGEIISVNTGDEVAMNTMIISIVDIDGSGNGSGLIKVPMMNNIKIGVALSGIKVAKGGCIVAGKAETSGIDVAILNEKQRQNLVKAYEIYKITLDIAEELAPEIAKGINSVKDNFEALKAKIEATRKLLAQSNLEDLSEVLNNCAEIVSQSRTAQDSLEKTICLIKTGKAKGNIAKLEKASKANIDFINKLGPALVQCQSKPNWQNWEQTHGEGGPCADFDYSEFECKKELKGVFGVDKSKNTQKLTLKLCDNTIENDKVYIKSDEKCGFKALFTSNDGSKTADITLTINGSNKEVSIKSFTIKTNESQDLELENMPEGKYIISYKDANKDLRISFYFRNKKYDFACSVCGRDLIISKTSLDIFFPSSKIIKEHPEVLGYFNDALKKGGFNTCYRHAHFFSQCFVESAGFNASSEIPRYGIDNLLGTFYRNSNADGPKEHWYKQSFWDDKDYLNYVVKRVFEKVNVGEVADKTPKTYHTYKFSGSETDTVRVVLSFDNTPKKGIFKSVSFSKEKQNSNAENVMNVAYANKLGNGDSKSGDGYKYRGRGAIQITGKTIYTGVSNKCNALFGTNYDFNTTPEKVAETLPTVQSAVTYFIWKGEDVGSNVLKIMDGDNSGKVTKVVNSAGLESATRKSKFESFIKDIYFDCKPKKQ